MAYVLEPDDLKATLEAAQAELVKLIGERAAIDERLTKLQSDVVHLAALCGVEVDDPVKQLGLTDAIRHILSTNRRPLNIRQVLEALTASGFDTASYKNIAANIHTVIRRLIESKEVLPRGGGAFFIWAAATRPLFVPLIGRKANK
jgi:hypothetical protein